MFDNLTTDMQESIILQGQQSGHLGSVTWDTASPEEQESRKESGREGGKSVFGTLDPEIQADIRQHGRDNCHLGGPGGTSAWATASPEEQDRRRNIGREVFANLTSEKQQAIIHAGIVASRENAERRTEEDIEFMRDQGRFPFAKKTPQEMERISSLQNAGLKRGHERMTAAAEERYLVEGAPKIAPDHKVWDCKGLCKFQCCISLTLIDFVGVSDLKILTWLHNHNLQDRECNRGEEGPDGVRSIQRNCSGHCRPVSLLAGRGLGMKCDKCHYMHKGGLRGFWSMGKLGPCRMVAVVFAIITGVSYKSLRSMGIKVARGTWTRYVKDCGMVLSESMERNRREEKYWMAQWDEVAIGKRKNHRYYINSLQSSAVS